MDETKTDIDSTDKALYEGYQTAVRELVAAQNALRAAQEKHDKALGLIQQRAVQ